MLSKPTESIEQAVKFIARQALAAAQRLVTLDNEAKNRALQHLANLLLEEETTILESNSKDIFACQGKSLDQIATQIQLTKGRLRALAKEIKDIAAMHNPIGEKFDYAKTSGGLNIQKVRVPIGVIGVIIEHDPVSAIRTVALCIKAGNACILYGDGESVHTHSLWADLCARVLRENHLPPRAVQLIPSFDRQALQFLLKQESFVQCILPQCGDTLLEYITEHTTIPIMREHRGVCNLYIDKAADPVLAENILINARCADPSANSSVKNLFIHQAIAQTLLPTLAHALINKNVELRIDSAAEGILLGEDGIPLNPLSESDLKEDIRDLILAIKIVFSIESAIDDINTYGSGLADAIVTTDADAANKFFAGVNSSTVYWNASPLFTDGVEFEIGGDIGVSSDRMHVGGIMRLNELCAYKYIISGTGQIKTH